MRLLAHQSVRLAQEDLGGQVAPQLAAERAGDHDGLERELFHTRRHLAATPLARYDETLAARNAAKHGTSIGEEEANTQGRIHPRIFESAREGWGTTRAR